MMMLGQVAILRKRVAVLLVSALAAVSLCASAEAGGKCARTRHRLAGHCVSALTAHSWSDSTRMALLSMRSSSR